MSKIPRCVCGRRVARLKRDANLYCNYITISSNAFTSTRLCVNCFDFVWINMKLLDSILGNKKPCYFEETMEDGIQYCSIEYRCSELKFNILKRFLRERDRMNKMYKHTLPTSEGMIYLAPCKNNKLS